MKPGTETHFSHLGDEEGYECQKEPGVGPSLILGSEASEENADLQTGENSLRAEKFMSSSSIHHRTQGLSWRWPLVHDMVFHCDSDPKQQV